MHCSIPPRLVETELYDPGRPCNPIWAPTKVPRTLNQLESFEYTTKTDLEEFMLAMLPWIHDLKDKPDRRYWNLIFNVAKESINKPEINRKIEL